MEEASAWCRLRQTAHALMHRGPDMANDDTVETVDRLLGFLSGRAAMPVVRSEAEHTITLDWEIPPDDRLEIVVFAGRFDVYRYQGERKQIRLIDYSPGDPIPDELVQHLPMHSA